MSRSKYLAPVSLAAVALAAVIGSFAIAGPSQDQAQGTPPEMQLPPGWTAEDMEACMVAGTPGEMHAHLAKGVGTWQAKTTMWMYPGAEPMESEGEMVTESIMDGRYVRTNMTGEIPGMGEYKGEGVYGYDNVAGHFVSNWFDSMSTGIMDGKGKLSEDGKTLTWTYSYHCPITKKPVTMREVETVLGPDSKTLEMFGADPKSGKEFKMMSIQLDRQDGANASR